MTVRCARCDAAYDGDFARADLAGHAAEAGHALCVIDGRSLTLFERQACARCVARTRADLADLAARAPELEQETARVASSTPSGLPRAPRKGRTSLPGGDALVLLGPGGKGRAETGETHRAGDAPSLALALADWEDDWRSVRGEPAAVVAPGEGDLVTRTLRAAHAYLAAHLDWAMAEHPAVDEFADDIAALRGRVLAALGDAEPVETGPSCLDCGVKLVRRYAERQARRRCAGHGDQVFGARCAWPYAGCCDRGGRDPNDNWACPSCGRDYDAAAYMLALRARFEQQQAA